MFNHIRNSEGGLDMSQFKQLMKSPSDISNLNNLTSWLPNDASVHERLFCVINSMTARPLCPSCGDVLKFRMFKLGYKKACCMKCALANPDVKNARSATWNEKYSGDNKEIVLQKRRQTSMMKYGVDSPNKVDSIKSKVLQTKLDKYGKEYGKIGSVAAAITVKERYGVSNAFQLTSKSVLQESHRQHNPDAFLILESKDAMTKMYEDMTIIQIADKLGVAYSTVNAYLEQHGVDRNNWKFVSGEEKEVVAFVKSIYSGLVVENDRTFMGNKKELDILLPEVKLAIEYNGTFYHSSNTDENKKYHVEKTSAVEAKDFSLLHIFSNEWNSKRKIWKSIIRHKLGLTSRRVFARKCKVVSIDNIAAKQFFETNHMQGCGPSGTNIALTLDDEIVSCISYGPSRFSDNEIELYRFATLLDTVVVGGLGKLLSTLKTDIVSYANRRWSVGNVYEKTGFQFVSETPPNYWYVIDGELHSRHQFQKHKLENNKYIKTFDSNKTEKENMFANGHRIIYDSGNLKYVHKYNKG